MPKSESKVVTRPWWRRKRTWLIGLAGILAAASLWMRSYNEAVPGGLVRTQIGDYKSTEDMGWFPISLLRAVRKFPAYLDCIERVEGGGARPKWEAMTSDRQIKVCLYWIADHLGDLAATQFYFKELGYRSLASQLGLPGRDRSHLGVACKWPPAPCGLPKDRMNYRFNFVYEDGQLLGTEADQPLK